MNRSDSYSSGKRRGRRREARSERGGRGKVRETREARDTKESRRERKSGRGKDLFAKRPIQYSSEQRELQRGIQKFLQREMSENDAAVRSFRAREKVCPICGQPISPEDFGSAMTDRKTGLPAHFDCVLKQVSESEKTEQNERISYIGQGRFAVIRFENPHDLKHFTIRRTIEWEDRDNRSEWRTEVSGLFSQVK